VNASSGPVEVDAAPEVGVRNSQPEGIGRLVVLDALVCWNNLGRNVVFADRALRPRAVFGSTMFPGEDEASQYDLDVHAVLDAPELGLVVVLNHFGTVRGFRRTDVAAHRPARGAGGAGHGPAGGAQVAGRCPARVEPVARWAFAADVERAVMAAGRLVGSRPRSEGAEGVLVSAPLGDLALDARLPAQPRGAAFGEVTALAVVPSSAGPLVAMGGDGRLALALLEGDRLAPPRWEADVGFRVACLVWQGAALWAAGPARGGGVDDYDWDQLTGGGFATLDRNGSVLASGPLPGDVAWGTGGVAVAPFGGMLVAAGRTGCLHLVDPRDPARERSTPPPSASSLGIAHLAVAGRHAVWGFNRGGYRLHAYGPLAPGTA
jgi:hypothetical protein